MITSIAAGVLMCGCMWLMTLQQHSPKLCSQCTLGHSFAALLTLLDLC
jgi:hypothetical protein